jgi:hypothetical protein
MYECPTRYFKISGNNIVHVVGLIVVILSSTMHGMNNIKFINTLGSKQLIFVRRKTLQITKKSWLPAPTVLHCAIRRYITA